MWSDFCKKFKYNPEDYKFSIEELISSNLKNPDSRYLLLIYEHAYVF